VAEHLKVKVYVDRRRYRILGQLGWTEKQMSLLTTKPDESMLWVVPLGHINMKQLPNYLQVQIGAFRKSFDRVVGFRPTGWSHSSSKKAGAASGSSIISTTTRGKFTVHGVPYSEHSSFPELLDCLRCLKPKRIVPTVSVSKSQQQVDLLLRNLS
jgi:DNA cross-link repair 1A protein